MSKQKKNCKIRAIKPADYPALADFLAEPPSREVVEKPEIALYIDGFGSQKGDIGVVAEQNGKIIGAAWTRIIPGFGHVDDDTPELAISVLPEYRNQGIGAKLLKQLFTQLAQKGFKQTSLSVQKANPALRLYERMEYKTVSENGEDVVMVRELKKELQSYGAGLGISFGLLFGVVVGVITDDLGLWIGVGLCLGIAVGGGWYAVDKRKKK
ncbi:MAG: GNAT family N-acetyltransferase [Oscillospiraceae bacterium]|jgi:ribosomal protein S18 acetylase RimI-like enzyme|nr:GNAT family N-acetyltransferase [Oscillospiraceae bacterium]